MNPDNSIPTNKVPLFFRGQEGGDRCVLGSDLIDQSGAKLIDLDLTPGWPEVSSASWFYFLITGLT